MTINEWAWCVIVIVIALQIQFERHCGRERDAAIEQLKTEVKFLGERLNDRPSTFEVLLYIEDANKRKATSVNKSIDRNFHKDDGRWEVCQRWPGYPFVKWVWTWPGRTTEETVYTESPEGSPPPPLSECDFSDDFKPGTKDNLSRKAVRDVPDDLLP